MADFSGINSTLNNKPNELSNKENPGLSQINRSIQQNKKIYNPVQVNPKIMKLLQDTENELNNTSVIYDALHQISPNEFINQSQFNLTGDKSQITQYQHHTQVNTTGTVSLNFIIKIEG